MCNLLRGTLPGMQENAIVIVRDYRFRPINVTNKISQEFTNLYQNLNTPAPEVSSESQEALEAVV